MKRLVFAAFAAIALAASAELKIGTVDMMLLVRNHPSYEINRDYLRNTERDMQKELDSMQDGLRDLQEEAQTIAKELQNPMLAETEKQKSEKKIADIQQRYLRQQQELRAKAVKSQDDLAKTEAGLLKSQADDLKKRISEYAVANGYDLILDSAAAIYDRGTSDVTDDILRSMNVDPETARAKEKSANESK
ncbi:MAG: OmpH family outer membrane protein [Kiritimatiellae bacterium]|nr:OmpH family outer membrane protein [Kiritimatiellia bacterium]